MVTSTVPTICTHSSLEGVVVGVVGAALRTGECEPLTVFVALLVRQLGRSSQDVVALLFPLVLLLRPEMTGVQTWGGRGNILVSGFFPTAGKYACVVRVVNSAQGVCTRVLQENCLRPTYGS